MRISTHVVEARTGSGASGVPVVLEFHTGGEEWRFLGSGITDENGQIRQLILAEFEPVAGVYRMTFDTSGMAGTVPRTVLTLRVNHPYRNYHIPLVLRAQEEVTLHDVL
ncbi:MAG: hydroxyisourate hydrolase [Bryobacteraceae bacterium]